MLKAKQFVDSIRKSRHGLLPPPSTLSKQQLQLAKTHSTEMNRTFDKSASASALDISPSTLESLLWLNLYAGQHHHNLKIAGRAQRDPLSSRFKTPQFYTLLLQSLSQEPTSNFSWALQVYADLNNTNPASEVLHQATTSLWKCASSCTDFTQLLSLKILYENCISKAFPDTATEAKYLACVMEILLNTSQHQFATDHLKTCLAHFTGPDQKAFLKELPLAKLLASYCANHDTVSLVWFLENLAAHFPASFVSAEQWASLLNLGLSLNSYELVKFIYSNVFMEGLEDQVSVEDVVLLNKFVQYSKSNIFFASLTDSTLSHILQTLASSGDVESTLNLIEWHYIHKSLKGEKALTNELCIAIIRSYCLFDDDAHDPKDSSQYDKSVKNVIDVIQSFVSRGESALSYKDVTDALSHKFNTYHAYDAKVHSSAAKEEAHMHPEELADEEPSIPQKRTNPNVNVSSQGSVLLNTEILRRFTRDHISYATDKKYSIQTLKLFIDCLLNHLKKYQNSSSIYVALRELQSMNPRFRQEWLTPASIDIVVHSISMSQPSMASGLRLFQALKRDNLLTLTRVENFILSSLRGVSYNALLEFYVYEYLKMAPAAFAPAVRQRILDFKNLNEQGRELLSCLSNPNDATVDEMWKAHGFNSTAPAIADSTGEFARYSEMDRRDEKLVAAIFI